MFWIWFVSRCTQGVTQPMRYLRHHLLFSLQVLFVFLHFLLLIQLWDMLVMHRAYQYGAWLAGGIATFSLLFGCTIVTNMMHGYHTDFWLRLYAGTLLTLCGIVGASALLLLA